MRTPVYEITVDGDDISSTLQPLLISVTVRHVEGQMSRADIELDDSYGQIVLPRSGAEIVIGLGYLEEDGPIEVFRGFTNDPGSKGGEGSGKGHRKSRSTGAAGTHHHNHQHDHLASQGSRQQGRILVLTATSADPTKAGKASIEMHQDGGTLGDFLKKVFDKAGIEVMVDDAIGQVSRDYWGAANESPWALGARLMREVGGAMNIFGSTAVFTQRGSQNSASGAALTGISAVWGVNLISWSICPDIARTSYDAFATRWYDLDEAKHKVEIQAGSSSGSGSGGSSGSSSGVTMTER